MSVFDVFILPGLGVWLSYNDVYTTDDKRLFRNQDLIIMVNKQWETKEIFPKSGVREKKQNQ